MSYKKDLELLKGYITPTNYGDILQSRFNFECVKDFLCKDGIISDKTFNNAYLHIDKNKKKTYLCCGSYSLRIE